MQSEQFALAKQYAGKITFPKQDREKKLVEPKIKDTIIDLIEWVEKEKTRSNGIFLDLPSLEELLQKWEEDNSILRYMCESERIFSLEAFFSAIIDQRIKQKDFEKAIELAQFVKDNGKRLCWNCGAKLSIIEFHYSLFRQIAVGICKNQDFNAAKEFIEKYIPKDAGLVYHELLQGTRSLNNSYPLETIVYNFLVREALERNELSLAQKIFNEHLISTSEEDEDEHILICPEVTRETLLKLLSSLVKNGKLKIASELSITYGVGIENLKEEAVYYLRKNKIETAEKILAQMQEANKLNRDEKLEIANRIDWLNNAISFVKI